MVGTVAWILAITLPPHRAYALETYVIEVSHNDELFIINGEKFEAQSYCFDVEAGDWLVELPASDPEIGIELSRGFDGRLTRDAALQALSERKPFKLDKEFSLDRRTDVSLFDSEIEERFFCEWIPSALGPNSAHWFVPQASLDRLLESHGIFEAGARRVDFLFA